MSKVFTHLLFKDKQLVKLATLFFLCVHIAIVAADLGLSNGPVVHVDVQCSGTEMTLSECLSDEETGLASLITDPTYCSKYAGVICNGKHV